MLKAVLTSYQLFMEPECIFILPSFGKLILLAMLQDCGLSADSQTISQPYSEEHGVNLVNTTAVGVFSKTKLVGEMLFGVLESDLPLGIGIKLPCGSANIPDFEGKKIFLKGELQYHIWTEIPEIEVGKVKISMISEICVTNIGDSIISLEGIDIYG